MKHRVPPGPDCGFLNLGFARRFARDPLNVLLDIGRTYGDLAYFQLGPYRGYLVNHPDLIREVLVTKARHFRKHEKQRKILGKIDGNGLVLSEGDFWLRQRRLVQPAFAPKRIARYADVTVERTRKLTEGWKTGDTFDIANAMTHLTLEIIAKTMFDVELTGRAAKLREAVHTLSEILFREMASPFILPDWMPLPVKQRKRKALNLLDDLIWEIIRERRATGEDRGDLLSMLLLAVDAGGDGGGMSDRQVRDEAMTLFNAGHDTTAAALAWVWYLLATNTESEERAALEVSTTLAGRAASFGDLSGLSFVESVIKETLRLYPPAWALFIRVPITDVELGQYSVPAGSWVYIIPWVTQRDSRWFSEPDLFDPDRYSSKRAEALPQYAWFPFGIGPHACIGQSFAMTEMTLIVATVLQRFRLRLADEHADVIPEPFLAIRPKNGLTVMVEER